MYKVVVKNDEGKVIRTHLFHTERQAEKYENDQLKHNPVAWKFDFEITKNDLGPCKNPAHQYPEPGSMCPDCKTFWS